MTRVATIVMPRLRTAVVALNTVADHAPPIEMAATADGEAWLAPRTVMIGRYPVVTPLRSVW
jgi:hypothetical protein